MNIASAKKDEAVDYISKEYFEKSLNLVGEIVQHVRTHVVSCTWHDRPVKSYMRIFWIPIYGIIYLVYVSHAL